MDVSTPPGIIIEQGQAWMCKEIFFVAPTYW